MYTFQKQPNEVLDYDVDMSRWFELSPGDDIQSVTVSVEAIGEDVSTLVLGPDGHPETVLMGATPVRFKVWIGGGTDFIDYVVTCRVFTEQDRKKEIEFKVKVRDV